jgi:hypothetical protein
MSPFPIIEAKENKDWNLHAFKIINVEWVPKNTMKRKPKISKVAKMTIKCLLKHGLTFNYNINTWMPKRINVMNMKCVGQMFGLWFKLKKPNEEGMEISSIHMTFRRPIYIIQIEDKLENLRNFFDDAIVTT